MKFKQAVAILHKKVENVYHHFFTYTFFFFLKYFPF